MHSRCQYHQCRSDEELIPLSEFLEADFESPVVVAVLIGGNVKETLCDVERSLVDGGGYASLQLHLQQLGIGRVLTERVL